MKRARRPLSDLPLRGKMGAVSALLRERRGMTRAAILAECERVGLQGGCLDRMVLHAKEAGYLLQAEKEAAPTSIKAPSPTMLVARAMNGVHQDEMSPPALVFLNDQLARQLAVAWMTCKGDEATWLETAGIRPYLEADARQLCRALRMNGICRDGGVTDQLAMRYISTMISAPLLKHKRKDKAL